MSLVTCIDFKDKVSLMSDGLMTNEDGSFHGDGFKKFIIKQDFFLAITISQIVAEVLFNEIEKKSFSSSEVKNLLDDLYKEFNKEYNIVLGTNSEKRFSYTIYTHFAGEYKMHQNIAHFSGYPLVMNSPNLEESYVIEFKNSIKKMSDNGTPLNTIISKQREFHNEVAKIDPTVNKELFHQYHSKY
ncbi:hypothetical protein Q7A53_09060 [Halobacillus rhizosphaerae]|uniref:hypothetical protein n=1 Tax=Halobacillus rhizosphaerae TaxID=3064889 RepID=UPI00398A7E00